MSYYDWLLLAVGVALQVLLLSAMLKGAWRRHPLLFAYVLVTFFDTVIQVAVLHYFGRNSAVHYQAYWIGDFVGTFLLLLLIIHLIRRAMLHHPRRRQVYWGLMLGMIATGVASVLFAETYSHNFRLGRLLTELGRNYYFSAVLLNAILWVTLMRVQHPDRQLYLFSSGLGLKLTGAAIAHALRLTTQTWFVANQILILSYLANLYVWYVAVKRFSPEGVPAGALPPREESGPPPSLEFSAKDR